MGMGRLSLLSLTTGHQPPATAPVSSPATPLRHSQSGFVLFRTIVRRTGGMLRSRLDATNDGAKEIHMKRGVLLGITVAMAMFVCADLTARAAQGDGASTIR